MIIECSECGAKNSSDKPPQPGKAYRCGKCHAEIALLETVGTPMVKARIYNTAEAVVPVPENTSGKGRLAVVPREIKGWNWGAYLLGVIWGVGNNVWWSFLLLIPYLDIVWVFVMGVKGSEWAWRSKRWDSVEHFKRTQKKWRNWGIGVTTIGILIGFIIILKPMLEFLEYLQTLLTVYVPTPLLSRLQ